MGIEDGIVKGQGPTPAEIMVVGEAPYIEEVSKGYPFAGKSGRELDRLLWEVGISRSECYVTNVVKTMREDGGNPTQDDVEYWKEELAAEIEKVKPQIIVTVGRIAARWFLGDVDMDQVHGIPRWDYNSNIIIHPCIHPAAGLHNTSESPRIWYDFQMLGALVAGNLVPKLMGRKEIPVSYTVNLPEKLPMEVAIDTEGIKKKPWGLSICGEPGTSYVVKVRTYNMIWLTRYLNKKRGISNVIFHNSLHDLPVLREFGIDTDLLDFDDTMVMAYNLCVEPQGLKPLAYRHCDMEMFSYDEILGDASKDVSVKYLRAVLNSGQEFSKREIVERQKDGGYRLYRPQTIKQRVAAIIRDMEAGKKPVDPAKRWKDIHPEVREPAEDELGKMPVATLDNIEPEVAVNYSARDADATLRLAPKLRALLRANDLERVYEMDKAIIPMVDQMHESGITISIPYFRNLSREFEAMMQEIGDNITRITGRPINPDSGPQVAKLLYDDLKLKPLYLTGSGARGSTDDKNLESLRSSHPVCGLICDFREVSKLKGSFADDLPWMVDKSDGRIHATFRITRTVSGRLSCSEPNLMAQPVRSELARKIRQGFVAAPGYVLLGLDLNQIEMRVAADQSGDENLKGRFIREEDIHRMTAAKMWGIKPEDVHPVTQRYPAKRVGFGVLTGITAKGLQNQMLVAGLPIREWTEPKCQSMITGWFGEYPDVGVYLERCKEEARRNSFIRDQWGRMRILPGIHSPNRKIKAEAERESHSHAISAGAQGIIKLQMAAIWKTIRHYKSDIKSLLQIHDELVFEVRQELADEMGQMIQWFMENTVKISIPVKAKYCIGQNWGELKD